MVASGQYILNLAKNDQGLDRGFYGNIRYMVSSFTAQDDRTVVVKAARDYYGLLYSMTFPVVPASQVEMANPVGTGPYVISSFEPASYMLLSANPRLVADPAPGAGNHRYLLSQQQGHDQRL